MDQAILGMLIVDIAFKFDGAMEGWIQLDPVQSHFLCVFHSPVLINTQFLKMYRFLLYIRFVAESTGHQMSSRLLSMKSANVLLELPARGSVISAGTSVPAIIISDLSSTAMPESGLLSDSASPGQTSKEKSEGEALDAEFRVAVLTVSDTVASGGGPDRRYGITCFLFNISTSTTLKL